VDAPPLPRHILRELRKGFSLEHVDKARNSLVTLSQTCVDPKIRADSARFILDTVKAEDADYFGGNPDALVQLAGMPRAERARAALQLFANQQCSRTDLETISRVLAADQSETIEMLRAQNVRLERQLAETKGDGRHQIDSDAFEGLRLPQESNEADEHEVSE
jgi:hypothetical protein